MAGTSEDGRPRIGDDSDFSGPPNNEPRTPKVPEMEEGQAEKIEESMAEIDDALGDIENPKPKSPQELAKRYRENLENLGVSKDEALRIQESVTVDGYHEETVYMGRVPVRLRTRLYLDTRRVYQELENKRLDLPASIQDFISRYNMVGSLVSVGKRKYPHVDDPMEASDEEIDKAFAQRLKMVDKLNDTVVARLMVLVFEFDEKIRAVFAEGAPQDF